MFNGETFIFLYVDISYNVFQHVHLFEPISFEQNVEIFFIPID